MENCWELLFNKGFVKRKVDSKLSNKRMEVSYNKLEQII